MNNRTANIFDAWIINQHNRLKERIASSTMFDDDAFQETYLTMREALTIKDIELDFEPVFIKLYRRMLARELSTEFRYPTPTPCSLFFSVLMKKTQKKLGKPRQRTFRRNKLMNM